MTVQHIENTKVRVEAESSPPDKAKKNPLALDHLK